jgi:hypothetical protein
VHEDAIRPAARVDLDVLDAVGVERDVPDVARDP